MIVLVSALVMTLNVFTFRIMSSTARLQGRHREATVLRVVSWVILALAIGFALLGMLILSGAIQ